MIAFIIIYNHITIIKKCGDEMRKRETPIPIKKEDEAFFQQFYDENKRFLYYIARKYTTDTNECDDLVQEAVVRLINNIPTLRDMSRCKIAQYIVLTVRTAFLDLQRRKKKENIIYFDDKVLEEMMLEALIPVDLEQQMESKSAVAKLKAELSKKDWTLLEGKYLLGLSQEELSRLIGVSPDSVRMTLHRAKVKARQILDKDTIIGGGKNGR